jgi:CDP-glucose 4,6-dehydratase
MHYLVTGHTGFKGSWLSSMLKMQGHQVSGVALDPPEKSLFNDAGLSDLLTQDHRVDIRDKFALQNAFARVQADVVIHLAAQPLVRESYKDPIGTFQTNVIGTLNVLESLRHSAPPRACLIITTDKVYRNLNHFRGYVETDELGGDDPYSASKAAADLATQSWVKSFGDFPVAIARAGNVIGGGDWAVDRLIPDLVSAFADGRIPKLRYPDSLRPWQHVLDCLNGYLVLSDALCSGSAQGAWNFGPEIQTDKTVASLTNEFARLWGTGTSWVRDERSQSHESGYLLLDSSKARRELNWIDKLPFGETVSWTVDWYKNALAGKNPRELLENQIHEFLDLVPVRIR